MKNSKEIDLEYIRSFKSRWPKLIEAADHPLTELLIERRNNGRWPYSRKLTNHESRFHLVIVYLIVIGLLVYFDQHMLINLLYFPLLFYIMVAARNKKLPSPYKEYYGLGGMMNNSDGTFTQLKLAPLNFKELVAIETVSRSIVLNQKPLTLPKMIFFICALILIDVFILNIGLQFGFQLIHYRILAGVLICKFVYELSYFTLNMSLMNQISLISAQIETPPIMGDTLYKIFILLVLALFVFMFSLLAFQFLPFIFFPIGLIIYFLIRPVFNFIWGDAVVEEHFDLSTKFAEVKYQTLET